MGRPPTSGYCHTCRRRRVKCDRGRPACERCLKAGHKCLGYEMPLRMQHFAASTEAGGSQALIRVSDTTKTSIEPSMPMELPLDAFRDQMAFSHLLANYRWAPFWRPLLRMSMDEQMQPDAVKADYTGTLAMAIGYMGRAINDPNMLAEGFELNGRVIRAVQSAIKIKSKSELARWSFTVVVLSMFQFAVELHTNAPHYYGMSKIIEFCGPECFQDEPMLTFLRQMRALHACITFGLNEPSFFEEERWQTVPWAHSPKTSHDLILDIFVHFPGLSVQVAPSAGHLTEPQKLEIETKVMGLLSSLYSWRHHWEVANPNAVTEVFQPLDADDVTNPWVKDLLSRPLEVKTAGQAVELIIYNASLVYLMHVLVVLRTGINQPQPFPTDMDPSVAKPADDPLYMPHELKYGWQPSIEGMRLFRLAPQLLSRSDGLAMLATSPLSFIYNSILGNEGLRRVFLSTICASQDYGNTDMELSILRIFR